MAENYDCYWCGESRIVFGFGSVIVAPGVPGRVLHETRRACKDHVGLLLDWMDTLQEPPTPTTGGTGPGSS